MQKALNRIFPSLCGNQAVRRAAYLSSWPSPNDMQTDFLLNFSVRFLSKLLRKDRNFDVKNEKIYDAVLQ